MAQALEEFEREIEHPLRALALGDPRLTTVVNRIDPVKRTFRKKLQALASDCTDLMPSDVQINGFELVRR